MRVVRVKASEQHGTAVVALTRYDIGLLLDALEESVAEFEGEVVPPEAALDVEAAERLIARLSVAIYAMDGVEWVPEDQRNERVSDMHREEWALFNAAADQDVHLTKIGDGRWEVGMTLEADLAAHDEQQVETLLSGDRIRLPDGREFKRVMTTEEARRAFGSANE